MTAVRRAARRGGALALAVVAAVSVAACGGEAEREPEVAGTSAWNAPAEPEAESSDEAESSAESESAAPEARTPDYDGRWSGRTNQGMAVRFTDADNAVTKFLIVGRFRGSACPMSSQKVNITEMSMPIEDGRWGEGTLRGSFPSPTTAVGRMRFIADSVVRDMGCRSVVVTWTAEK